jgi:hypothetical protein
MSKRVEKPRVKRAPAKGHRQGARLATRGKIDTSGNIQPLEKLLHDTYARRACHRL